MCFLRGTAIRTPQGETPIENLQIGDLVETVNGSAQPVRWIGRRTYKRSGPSWHESMLPVRIARHAIDDQTPHRDLYLSPYHALLVDGVLVRVKDLVNGVTVAPALPDDRSSIEYFHLVLDTHEIILAEGAPAETFRIADNNHESFDNFVEFERLYPAEQQPTMEAFAPTVGYGGGGREHLKALIRFGVRRFVRRPDPVEDAYDRIAARVPLVVS
ncbi:Hint domain-containing protein [Ferirhizobium litorale]|nr:Hint domain-containing protein [Fererhizobium litorale]